MKKVLTASILAITSAFCMNASAQTSPVTGTLNVNVSLTSVCQIGTASGNTTIPNINILYTSFQAEPANTKSDFTVRCTNGLNFGIGINDVVGSVRGIDYFASVSASSASPTLTSNGAALTGQSALTTGTPYYVHTTAPGGQAGNVLVATAQSRTVTVTF